MGLVVSPDLGVDGAALSGGARRALDPLFRLALPPCSIPESLVWRGFCEVCWWSGGFTQGTLSTLFVPRWRLPAIARRRWIVASHDKTFDRRVAGAEWRLSMIEWRYFASGWRRSAFERRLSAFGKRVAMIATRLWTIESRLPEVLSRHSGSGRRGWGRACVRAKKERAALGPPLILCLQPIQNFEILHEQTVPKPLHILAILVSSRF